MVNRQFIAFLSLLALVSSQSAPLLATSTGEETTFNKDELRKAELDKHNAFRKLHGVPPLLLSDSLNAIAQTFSDTLFNSHTMAHSAAAINGEYGENLFKSRGSPTYYFPAEGISGSWYSEIKNYNFSSGQALTPGLQIYHFTSMIWKAV